MGLVTAGAGCRPDRADARGDRAGVDPAVGGRGDARHRVRHGRDSPCYHRVPPLDPASVSDAQAGAARHRDVVHARHRGGLRARRHACRPSQPHVLHRPRTLSLAPRPCRSSRLARPYRRAGASRRAGAGGSGFPARRRGCAATRVPGAYGPVHSLPGGVLRLPHGRGWPAGGLARDRALLHATSPRPLTGWTWWRSGQPPTGRP